MKILELWRWRVTDPDTGRAYQTRHRMTEADAMLLDPRASRVPGSLEVRSVPETTEERCAAATSAWLTGGRSRVGW